MYKNILVPLDGSESSKNALSQAIKLAKKENSKIAAVKVIPSYEGEMEISLAPDIEESIRKPAEKILEEADRMADAEGISIDTILEEGVVHDEIINVAQLRNCDLIVMGRSGLSALARAFMGSVTARVIGYSPIDVLVVPKDAVLKWQNILLAADGSKYSEAATERVLDIAQTYGGELKVVSVIDVPDEAYAEIPDVIDKMAEGARDIVKSVKDRAEVSSIKTAVFVKEGDASKQIIDTANELGVGMICMGNYGRTGLKRLLMGSVTEKVIGHATCPVLVVKLQQ